MIEHAIFQTMKVTLLGRGRKHKSKAKKAHKPCVNASGPRKGRLKKGWRFGANGRCLRAKKK